MPLNKSKGQIYPSHKVDYQSNICGHYDCLHEARKRGLLKEDKSQ